MPIAENILENLASILASILRQTSNFTNKNTAIAGRWDYSQKLSNVIINVLIFLMHQKIHSHFLYKFNLSFKSELGNTFQIQKPNNNADFGHSGIVYYPN